MTALSDVQPEDWRGFRRVARRYERELRRIKNATAVPAEALRRFAAEAINPKSKQNGVR